MPIKKSAGYTLLETLIAVGIVGVLVSLSWPMYIQCLETVKRTLGLE